MIHRRLEKLRKQKRDYDSYLASAHEHSRPELGREYRHRLDILQNEISRLDAELKERGGIPADSLDIQKGDIVLINGHLMKIKRANKNTFTCLDMHVTYANGKPWELQLDRSQLTKRYYTAAEWEELSDEQRTTFLQR